MMDVALRELTVRDLLPAQALLTTALPYDRSDVVTAEKLLASNFRRDRFSVGAFSPDGELLGVMALAGRWIKLLAVKPAVQRRERRRSCGWAIIPATICRQGSMSAT